MTISLTDFNNLSQSEARDCLMQCCTSMRWANELVNKRPFESLDEVLSSSDAVWSTMQESDYLQAFDGHPQIGDVSTLQKKYQNTASSAAGEQSAVNDADDKTLNELVIANKAYLDKFGFIFIVFASDKTAKQMLDLLNARLPNTREQELINAACEQNKITRLRLNKLIQTT